MITIILNLGFLYVLNIAVMRMYNSLNPMITHWNQHKNDTHFSMENKNFDWSFEMSAVLVESKD